MAMVKVVAESGKESMLQKNATASINPARCINCGTCREVCPTGAIREMQRTICRVCPECTGKPGLRYGEIVALATEKACTTGCPLGISPQGYVNLVKAGKEKEAYKLVWEKNPLPSVCARVCHHPCEEYCKRGILVDSPISIRSIKRYLSENVEYELEPYTQVYEERVAIIGAGPAGLSAGHYLAQEGYDVTIFEREAEPGGMLMRGIPEFRLDRDVVRAEIQKLRDAGLKIQTGAVISAGMIEKLKKEYDAVILAVGAPNSKELMIEGRRMNGIMTAMEYLQQTNHGQEIMHHMAQCYEETGDVVVIGGGSVAMDTARAAVRNHADSVTVICLESGEAVPAHKWELEEAKEEGVRIIEGVSPLRFCGDVRLNLTGVEVGKVSNFNKDETGRISFDTDKENPEFIPAKIVIMAVGQGVDACWQPFKQERPEQIFFAGDVDSAKCSVIDALGSGRKAALAAASYLRGYPLKDALETHTLNRAPVSEKIYPQTKSKMLSPKLPRLSMEERLNTFDEVDGVYSKEAALREVSRCLECGYEAVDPDLCIGCGTCAKNCPKKDVITFVPVERGEAI